MLAVPKMMQEMNEKIKLIQQRLTTAQRRQKCYADKRQRPLEFQEGDRVLLRISPSKGIKRFRKKGKLSSNSSGLLKSRRG